MSIKLNLEEKDNNDNNDNNKTNKQKENKWKELLYELFYEIKSEILGCKIEIEEDEYQENIRTISFRKLIKYVHDSIQILIKKKIDDSKLEQKEEDEKYYRELNSKNNTNYIPLLNDEKKLYENLIHKLESKERNLTKIYFQNKLQKDALENKIGEYIEMEEEFEEMKTKLKYEEGRFLNNDRKDNEIIILRGENSNLKQSIIKLEEKIKKYENLKENNNKIIKKLQKEIKHLKLKIDELQKQNEILNAHNINININNIEGINNKNRNQNNNNNDSLSKGEIIINKNNNIKNKMFPFQKIKNKFITNNNPNNNNILNNTRNESLERTKSDLLYKYLTGSKAHRNNIFLNNSSAKSIHLPYNNNKIKGSHNHNHHHNNSNSHMPIFNNQINMKNFNIYKKIISSRDSNNIRSTKYRRNPNNIIDFNSL